MRIMLFCPTCCTDTLHDSSGCIKCGEVKKIRDKEEFLSTRSKMSIEDRLVALESDIYDLKQVKPDLIKC